MNTDTNRSVYLYTPKHIADIPKEEPTRSLCEKLGDAVRAVRRATFEEKVMGVVGAVCAVGGLISFGGAVASAISDSAKSVSLYDTLESKIPRAIVTTECTHITVNGGDECKVGERKHDKKDNTYRTCRSSEEPYDTVGGYGHRLRRITVDIFKNNTCEATKLEDKFLSEEIGKLHRNCKLFDLTNPSDITGRANHAKYKFACGNLDDGLGDLISGVEQICKKTIEIVKSSPQKDIENQNTFWQLKKLHDSYKQHVPELRIHEVIPKYANQINDVLPINLKSEHLFIKPYPTELPTTQEPPHARSRTGLYAAMGASGTLAGGILLAGWARSTILKAGKTQVEFNFHELSNTIEMEINGDGFFLKTDDPEIKENLKSMLIKAAGVSMKAGIHIGEVYDAIIEVCDKVDAILGNPEVGDSVMPVVREWFTQNYEKEFHAHLVSLGIELPQVVKWASPKDPETSQEEMAMITAKLHTMNMV